MNLRLLNKCRTPMVICLIIGLISYIHVVSVASHVFCCLSVAIAVIASNISI